MGAFLCKHSIISCASKSRAKNVKKVLLPEKPTTSSRSKTWQPEEVTSAQAMTVVISHQACDQGWKIPPKCRRNTREEFHQAYPAFCPLSGDSGPSMEYITFSDNALPSLRPYRVFSRPEPMSSCPQHQGGNRLGRRMIQHCLSPGFLIPALPRMFPTILTPCPKDEAGGLCFAHPGTEQMPYSNHCTELLRRFYTPKCRLLEYSSLPDCLSRATSSAKQRKPLEQAACKQTASCIITGMH